MPQGSILGPYFFNIFINYFFLLIESTALCNYADDSTMYSSGKNANIVISRLRHGFVIISEWFYENYKFLSKNKCHFLILGFNETVPDFSLNSTTNENVGNNGKFFHELSIYLLSVDRCLLQWVVIKESFSNDYESSFFMLSTLNEKKTHQFY